MRFSTALIFTGLAAQQASATWNRNPGYFKNPEYNNNECSDKQKEGFNWGDLPEGGFGGYGDFNFGGGWSCKNKFGKRDTLTKRTFGSKCITNKVRKDKPANFDCKKRKEGFSIKEIQVSVEFDCDVEFHYKMPDKSICKHVASCKKDGTIVKNTQCGGAEEVDVYLGHHNEKGRDDCEIGFHHIEFDCNPPYQPPGKPPKTSDVKSTQPATTTTEEVPSSTSAPAESTTTSDKVESSTTSDKIESTTTTDKVESSTSTDKVESSTTTEEVKTTSPPVDTPYSTLPPYSNSTTTHPPPESSAATTDVPPPSSTDAPPPSSSDVSPSSSTDIPGYSQPPSKETTSDVPPPSTTSEAVPTTSSPPTGGYTPPDVLPKCLDTWLEINTECKDNTDCNCYCKNPDFTKNVIDCVAAWSTDDKIKEALKYLQGICAPYVPENPGIVTHTVPGYNEPTPPPTTETTGGYAPPVPTGPVTTITYKTTATVPCTDNCYGGTTTTVISTEVTVPQVYFPTPPADNPSTTAPIELVPGTPPPVPAQTTGGYAPYPVPSSLTTTIVPSGTGGYTAPPPEFTGAASRAQVGFVAGLGAVAALFAL